jgi:hypothetical protein
MKCPLPCSLPSPMFHPPFRPTRRRSNCCAVFKLLRCQRWCVWCAPATTLGRRSFLAFHPSSKNEANRREWLYFHPNCPFALPKSHRYRISPHGFDHAESRRARATSSLGPFLLSRTTVSPPVTASRGTTPTDWPGPQAYQSPRKHHPLDTSIRILSSSSLSRYLSSPLPTLPLSTPLVS